MAKIRSSQSLESGWSFRQTDRQDEWLSVKKVPTNVHLDLMDHRRYDPVVVEHILLKVAESRIRLSTSMRWPSNGSARSPGPTA